MATKPMPLSVRVPLLCIGFFVMVWLSFGHMAIAGSPNLASSPQTEAEAEAEAEAMRMRAFEGAQWVMATGAARAVAQVGARAAVGDGPLGQSIRQRQQLEAQLSAARRDIAQAADPAAALVETAALAAALDRLDAEIREAFPAYSEIANPQPLGLTALRRLLAPREALVMFLSSRTSTYVWAISQDATAWHRADLAAADLAMMVRALRLDLDPTAPSRAAVALKPNSAGTGGAPFDMNTAYQLYQHLLAPVSGVLAGADHLFVVKDGALSSLPLGVLLTAPPPPQTTAQSRYRDAPWLIRRFALTTLPAVSSLASIRSSKPRDTARTSLAFLGFGDPDFQGASIETGQIAAGRNAPEQVAAVQSRSIPAFFDASGSRLEAIRGLAPLPGTARELRRIAQIFPAGHAEIHTGAAASEAAVKAADLSGAAIISFATHGLVTGDMSGLAEPALALSPPAKATALDDGLLTASEASELTLNADWVILSACNTAAGDGTPGAEGLSGLARAFLFAGARSILVSHWPVRDDVAATLTSETLRRLNLDPAMGRSRALQLAILDVIADGGDPTLAHPSAWAPFVVVGEGGALDQ